MDRKNWKILLVDDEVEFITTLAERLELRGMAVRVVHDGMTALEAAAKEEPQAMVLDLMMPGLNGLDVLRRVRRDHPAVPVILLTGQGKAQDGAEGVKLGAFSYMTKPLDLEELLGTLGQAIGARA